MSLNVSTSVLETIDPKEFERIGKHYRSEVTKSLINAVKSDVKVLDKVNSLSLISQLLNNNIITITDLSEKRKCELANNISVDNYEMKKKLYKSTSYMDHEQLKFIKCKNKQDIFRWTRRGDYGYCSVTNAFIHSLPNDIVENMLSWLLSEMTLTDRNLNSRHLIRSFIFYFVSTGNIKTIKEEFFKYKWFPHTIRSIKDYNLKQYLSESDLKLLEYEGTIHKLKVNKTSKLFNSKLNSLFDEDTSETNSEEIKVVNVSDNEWWQDEDETEKDDYDY